MSTTKRKISYWGIEFAKKDGQIYFDPSKFIRLMTYIKSLNPNYLLSRDEKQNKAISIDSIREEKIQGLHLIKCVFKSCTYNHSPNYMSSIDGSERPTDKLLTEGDKELTHICFRIDSNEAYTVLEERRNGVSMGAAIAYLNKMLKKYIEEEKIHEEFSIQSSLIPFDDFITGLGKTNTISAVELFAEKRIIGSEFLNLMDFDSNTQDEVTICIKAKRRKTLSKDSVVRLFRKITSGGEMTNRIRIRGRDDNKMSILLDSMNGKKVDEITVDLKENGIVDSYSIFSKLKELLGVNE